MRAMYYSEWSHRCPQFGLHVLCSIFQVVGHCRDDHVDFHRLLDHLFMRVCLLRGASQCSSAGLHLNPLLTYVTIPM